MIIPNIWKVIKVMFQTTNQPYFQQWTCGQWGVTRLPKAARAWSRSRIDWVYSPFSQNYTLLLSVASPVIYILHIYIYIYIYTCTYIIYPEKWFGLSLGNPRWQAFHYL